MLADVVLILKMCWCGAGENVMVWCRADVV